MEIDRLTSGIGQSEAVTEPGLCEDKCRFRGIRLDLLSQLMLIDKDVQIFHFTSVVRSPHGLQDLAVWNCHVWIRDEIVKNLELPRRKADISSTAQHVAGVAIDLDLVETHQVRALLRRKGQAPQ